MQHQLAHSATSVNSLVGDSGTVNQVFVQPFSCHDSLKSLFLPTEVDFVHKAPLRSEYQARNRQRQNLSVLAS